MPDIEWIKFSVYDKENPQHTAFVLGNWSNALREVNGYSKKTGHEFRGVRKNIERLCDRAKPLIAHSEMGEPYYGFICSEYSEDGDQVLHYLYVRALWRRKGVGTMLMKTSFNRLGKDPIYQTYPMKHSGFYKKKWLLNYEPRRKHV